MSQEPTGTSGPTAPRSPRRRVDAGPRPFFTLSILYLFFFFFLFSFALVAPALWDVAQNVPVGPEQERAAYEAARLAAGGRLLPAFLLSVATLVAGVKFQVLPGLRD